MVSKYNYQVNSLTFEIKEITDWQVKAQICNTVLRNLPHWFGIEEATLNYIEKSKGLPFFAAYQRETPIGFVYLYNHNEYTCEIYCMGILQRHHRKGIGKMLIAAAEEHCRKKGIKFLTVKTLADTHADEGYKKTRQFYLSVGFLPLEIFPDLWGEKNPCLFLVKNIL